MFAYQRNDAPLKRGIPLEDVGGAALYLLSDPSSRVTGEIHHVDSGYNVISPSSLHETSRAGRLGRATTRTL